MYPKVIKTSIDSDRWNYNLTGCKGKTYGKVFLPTSPYMTSQTISPINVATEGFNNEDLC